MQNPLFAPLTGAGLDAQIAAACVRFVDKAAQRGLATDRAWVVLEYIFERILAEVEAGRTLQEAIAQLQQEFRPVDA